MNQRVSEKDITLSVPSPWVSEALLGGAQGSPMGALGITAGMQRTLLKLHFAFIKVFWGNALSSGKQEPVSWEKISHSPGRNFFLLFCSDVQLRSLCCPKPAASPPSPAQTLEAPLLRARLWGSQRVGRRPGVTGGTPGIRGMQQGRR